MGKGKEYIFWFLWISNPKPINLFSAAGGEKFWWSIWDPNCFACKFINGEWIYGGGLFFLGFRYFIRTLGIAERRPWHCKKLHFTLNFRKNSFNDRNQVLFSSRRLDSLQTPALCRLWKFAEALLIVMNRWFSNDLVEYVFLCCRDIKFFPVQFHVLVENG